METIMHCFPLSWNITVDYVRKGSLQIEGASQHRHFLGTVGTPDRANYCNYRGAISVIIEGHYRHCKP